MLSHLALCCLPSAALSHIISSLPAWGQSQEDAGPAPIGLQTREFGFAFNHPGLAPEDCALPISSSPISTLTQLSREGENWYSG